MNNAGESSEDIRLVEWHYAQNVRLSRLAAEMGRLFTPGHNAEQTSEYEALRQEYLWQQHIKMEHDKLTPPNYSDHRFG